MVWRQHALSVSVRRGLQSVPAHTHGPASACNDTQIRRCAAHKVWRRVCDLIDQLLWLGREGDLPWAACRLARCMRGWGRGVSRDPSQAGLGNLD